MLALNPGIGDVDVMVASELMEAGRAVAAGFVTPDRTLTIASTSRFFVMDEKIAMADGRYDSGRLVQAIEQHSRAHVLIDMEAIARRTGAMINAVMLGVIAGSECLPIPAEAFEAAIRTDGKAVESNLRGFRAGLEAAQADRGPSTGHEPAAPATAPSSPISKAKSKAMPAAAREVMSEGVRRLTAYQDVDYARLYLDRLGGHPRGRRARMPPAGVFCARRRGTWRCA